MLSSLNATKIFVLLKRSRSSIITSSVFVVSKKYTISSIFLLNMDSSLSFSFVSVALSRICSSLILPFFLNHFTNLASAYQLAPPSPMYTNAISKHGNAFTLVINVYVLSGAIKQIMPHKIISSSNPINGFLHFFSGCNFLYLLCGILSESIE